MADRVVLQNASVSFSADMMRWKFGVVFLSCGGTCSSSPFSSCSVVFEGVLNEDGIIEGIWWRYGRHGYAVDRARYCDEKA
jgi:hypothetical protein